VLVNSSGRLINAARACGIQRLHRPLSQFLQPGCNFSERGIRVVTDRP
jgi:hypothetical protein